MRNEETKKTRGVYERNPGSGVWWIRYVDSDGRLRRETAGTKSSAIALVKLRKSDALRGKKLPENLRLRAVAFSELADDYLAYSKANNEGGDVDKYRIKTLKAAFGNRSADVPIADIRDWFNEQNWQPGTFNRCRTVLGLIYKLGIENKKVENNPVRLLKRRKEPKGRVRFLNQKEPDEENRLRKVILQNYAKHLPEFEIALNTGLRRKEQYVRIDWSCIDFLRADLFVPESKNGKSRHIPLNEDALRAFQALYTRRQRKNPIFVAERGSGVALEGARHWFERALKDAKIEDLTWHDMRHTFASRLVMAGVDLRTVAELMGHEKIQMTMRYAHLAPAHNAAAVKKLAAFNAVEKKRQKAKAPAIISPVAPLDPTGTTTDTDEKQDSKTVSANVQ